MLLLKKEEINTLKSKLTDNFYNMSLLELINKIKDVSIDLEVKTSDMKYKYKNKNKLEERTQQIILFGTKKSLENLNAEKSSEFFLDSTFRIIHAKFKGYKLLTISSFDINEKTAKLCGFVCYKYQDVISYERIISFIKENYNFIPKSVHTDYEYALYKAFDNVNIYEKGVIHIFSYFHYIKCIRKKMKTLKLTSNKLNKIAYEVLKNIEILSFIKQDKLENDIKFITERLNNDKEYSKLSNYLMENWFKKNPDLFNYSKILEYRNENENNQKILNNFF